MHGTIDTMAKPKRAGGSRTFFDVLLHPPEVLKDPMGNSSGRASADVAVTAGGDSRRVSCWLRGDAPGLPHKFTQGQLTVSLKTMSWQRYAIHRRVVVPHLDVGSP